METEISERKTKMKKNENKNIHINCEQMTLLYSVNQIKQWINLLSSESESLQQQQQKVKWINEPNWTEKVEEKTHWQ